MARRITDEWKARRNRAVELRKGGATFQQIADSEWTWNGKTGVLYANRQNARKAILAVLAEETIENREQMRQLHGARLERILRAMWPAMLAGGTDSANIALRTLRDLAALWGLNAPTKVEVTDHMDAEIERLVAEMVDDTSWDFTGVPGEVDGAQGVAGETLISPPPEGG